MRRLLKEKEWSARQQVSDNTRPKRYNLRRILNRSFGEGPQRLKATIEIRLSVLITQVCWQISVVLVNEPRIHL